MSLFPTYRPTFAVPSRAMTDTAESPRRGRPPGVKQKDRATLRVDDETYDRLRAFAEARGDSIASVVREAVVDYLNRSGS